MFVSTHQRTSRRLVQDSWPQSLSPMRAQHSILFNCPIAERNTGTLQQDGILTDAGYLLTLNLAQSEGQKEHFMSPAEIMIAPQSSCAATASCHQSHPATQSPRNKPTRVSSVFRCSFDSDSSNDNGFPQAQYDAHNNLDVPAPLRLGKHWFLVSRI
jgi:hypothetical protein